MSVSPPRPKGPPLNALRAFEAAARLGGFSNAADELSVTPGAISQHIKALEDWAGAPLFERRSQGVRLTAIGADLLPQFTSAFDQMGTAVRALRATTRQSTIRIAVLPSIAQLWLLPRMPEIRKRLPHLELSVSAMETPPNLNREMFDISLFFRPAAQADDLHVLDDDLVSPVCAPEIASRLQTPEDLTNEVLLHDDVWADDWPRWAEHAGCALPNLAEGPRFSLYSLAVEEAKNGAGVLIGHHSLIRAALSEAKLVAPFAEPLRTNAPLCLEVADKNLMSRDLRQMVAMLQ